LGPTEEYCQTFVASHTATIYLFFSPFGCIPLAASKELFEQLFLIFA
jgi:hypothetical protein